MEDFTSQQELAGEQVVYDMTSEFTCFLSNGYQSLVGSVTVNEAGIKLCSAMGQLLEIDTFDDILSVNEIEPLNFHTVILTFCTQRYVMVSYLLRKKQFIEIFKNLGIYRSEPRLPPESIGMKDPEIFAKDDTPVFSCTSRGSGQQLTAERQRHMMEESARRHEVVQEGNTKDPWSNRLEQDRYMQRQFRQQSMLNPIQMISSIQHARASELTGNGSYRNTSTIEHGHNDDRNVDRTIHKKNQLTEPQPAAPTTTITTTVNSSPSLSDSFVANIDSLKVLFPNHQEDKLKTILSECGYNLDSAISTILGENNCF